MMGDLLPKKGRRLLSPLATMLGPPRYTTGSASKKLECGARASTGASLVSAFRPLTFRWWNPPQRNNARIIQQITTRMSLFLSSLICSTHAHHPRCNSLLLLSGRKSKMISGIYKRSLEFDLYERYNFDKCYIFSSQRSLDLEKIANF